MEWRKIRWGHKQCSQQCDATRRRGIIQRKQASQVRSDASAHKNAKPRGQEEQANATGKTAQSKNMNEKRTAR